MVTSAFRTFPCGACFQVVQQGGFEEPFQDPAAIAADGGRG
jgi:hypothetical protein